MGFFIIFLIVLSLYVGKLGMWLITVFFGVAWLVSGNTITKPFFIPSKESLISVCKQFSGNNFYILDLIPSQKLENSKKNYPLPDSGSVIALVDFTTSGEGEFGLAIGYHGISWMGLQNSSPNMMYWEEFSSVSIGTDLQTNIKIGNRQVDNSKSSSDEVNLFRLLYKIQQCVLQNNSTDSPATPSGKPISPKPYTSTDSPVKPREIPISPVDILQKDLKKICSDYNGKSYFIVEGNIPKGDLDSCNKNYPVPCGGPVLALVFPTGGYGLAVGKYGISWKNPTETKINSIIWGSFLTVSITSNGASGIKIGSELFKMYASSYETDQAVSLLKNIQQCVRNSNIYAPAPVKEVESLKSSTDNRIDINKADYDALLSLPGIGAAEANRLINHRQQHGPFYSIDTVSEFLKLKPHHAKQWADKVIVTTVLTTDSQQPAKEPQKTGHGRTID